MTQKKQPSKKKNTMKKQTEEKKQTTVSEETTQTTTPSSTSDVPKRYYAQIWKKVQPADPKFDEIAGTLYWSDVKQDIIIEGLHPKYSSDVEGLLESDLTLPNGLFVSRYENPKEWIKNIHKAIFVDGFYGEKSMEMVDETQ